jgi:hypothetical protein
VAVIALLVLLIIVAIVFGSLGLGGLTALSVIGLLLSEALVLSLVLGATLVAVSSSAWPQGASSYRDAPPVEGGHLAVARCGRGAPTIAGGLRRDWWIGPVRRGALRASVRLG